MTDCSNFGRILYHPVLITTNILKRNWAREFLLEAQISRKYWRKIYSALREPVQLIFLRVYIHQVCLPHSQKKCYNDMSFDLDSPYQLNDFFGRVRIFQETFTWLPLVPSMWSLCNLKEVTRKKSEVILVICPLTNRNLQEEGKMWQFNLTF